MKLFIVTQEEGLTGSWHSGGAALVFAHDLADAKALAVEERATLYSGKIVGVSEPALDTAEVLQLAGKHQRRIILFPDAGCC